MKNVILKGSASLCLLIFLYASVYLDGISWTPFVICCITGGYLGLFAWANDWFNDKWEK